MPRLARGYAATLRASAEKPHSFILVPIAEFRARLSVTLGMVVLEIVGGPKLFRESIF
jgi:hypothetical protein